MHYNKQVTLNNTHLRHINRETPPIMTNSKSSQPDFETAKMINRDKKIYKAPTIMNP